MFLALKRETFAYVVVKKNCGNKSPFNRKSKNLRLIWQNDEADSVKVI